MPVFSIRRLPAVVAAFSLFTCLAASAALPPDVQAKVDKVKAKLVTMAADPSVVAAVKEANAKGAPEMSNGKWVDLPDTDPFVQNILKTKVSRQFADLESKDDTMNKLLLRDQKGNLVAASVRPLIWNNAARPVFAQPIKGQPWSADEIKPDTSTQIPSVHVAAPVLDGGKPIGVLHTAVTAK
jgi:hypothetical protein